jgi:hypothetical protein
MLAQCRIDDPTVEENFRSISDIVEELERFLELIIIVMRKGLNPNLDLLLGGSGGQIGCALSQMHSV